MTAPVSSRLSGTDVAILLFVAATWGFNNVLVKIATHYEPPLVTASVRFALQTLMLAPYIIRIERAQFGRMLIVALLSGPMHFSFFYTGFARAHDIAPMTVLLQLWISVSALLSILLLGERLSVRQVAGMGLALTGIAVMTFAPTMFSQMDATGFILGASLCWGTAAVLARRFGGFPVATLQSWMGLTCFPLLGLAAIAFEQRSPLEALHAPWPFWAASIATAVSAGLLGNALMYRMVRKHQVSRTTPLLLMTPLFTAMGSVAFLGEVVTPRMAAGGLITLAGLLWVAVAGRR